MATDWKTSLLGPLGRQHRSDEPTPKIVADSGALGWCSLYADIIDSGPLDGVEPARPHPTIIYHLRHPTQITRRLDGGKKETAYIRPRNICVIPAGHSVHWQHGGHPSILRVYLKSSTYQQLAEDLYPGGQAQLVPKFQIEDPLLEQLIIAVSDELRVGKGSSRPGPAKLFGDCLGDMIAAQLATRHSNRSGNNRAGSPAPLAGWRMRRLVEFIDEHLAADLSLENLAAEAGISPSHLVRSFVAASGKPPHQYVLERRIERAKHMLLNTELSVASIAFENGFSSQSHLSNHFRRFVGVPPGVYRRHPGI